MKTTVTPLLAALLTLPLTRGRALADSACFSDAARVCPNVEADDPGFLACLRGRWVDLSPSCQHDIIQVDRLASEFQSSCQRDVLRWCRDAPRGGGKVLECLDQHAFKLTDPCLHDVAIALEKVDLIANACSAELKKHCPGVPAGTGRRFVCLKSKARFLSDECREALRL